LQLIFKKYHFFWDFLPKNRVRTFGLKTTEKWEVIAGEKAFHHESFPGPKSFIYFNSRVLSEPLLASTSAPFFPQR